MPNRSYDHTASVEKWRSIISFADKWRFESMSYAAAKAYVALPDMEAADKIAMVQRYDFPREDLFDVYLGISTREKSLSIEEAHKVGLETLVRITQTREEIKTRSSTQHKLIVTNNLIDLKPSYYMR
jgi:hypothetical protein